MNPSPVARLSERCPVYITIRDNGGLTSRIFFAIALIIITLSGIIMLKGNKGIIGRGGIELIVGILIPILFLFLLLNRNNR